VSVLAELFSDICVIPFKVRIHGGIFTGSLFI